MTMTGLQLSEKVLKETGSPMSAFEIWEYAKSKGYDADCNLKGKTPDHTLGAQIYMNLQKKGDKSKFRKYSTRPQKFCLASLPQLPEKEIPREFSYGSKIEFKEKDLHPLLVAFVNSDDHFHANTKTIHEYHSEKRGKNGEKWMHPDLVAAHYSFQDYESVTSELAINLSEYVITLYSFEMKVNITNSNVREYYFQAVSNSSWANEGYLVAPIISDDALQQLQRLNASFGIGVIKLNTENVYESEILIPSKGNDSVDLGMVDDLTRINPEFREFIKNINNTLKTKDVIESQYDKVLDDDELKAWISDKKIHG